MALSDIRSSQLSALVDDEGSACVSCNRRQFLSDAALLAMSGVLVAACGDGIIGAGGESITGAVNASVRIADYATLAADGGIAILTGVSTPIAVVRQSATNYLAFSLICPHRGSTIRTFGTGFRCPNHLARFNASGTWIGGQSTSNMRQISVTLNATAGTLTLGSVI